MSDLGASAIEKVAQIVKFMKVEKMMQLMNENSKDLLLKEDMINKQNEPNIYGDDSNR